jgi:competence ComEA-like helix-hairpin-helix protein
MRLTLPATAGIVSSVLLLMGAGQGTTKSLPDGPGKTTLQSTCSNCHSLDHVTAKRRTGAAWEQIIDEMASRGADISDDQKTEIAKYLATYFGQVNVNTATQAALQTGLGLTDEEAKSLIDYRKQNGTIKDFEQLKTISGLGAAKLDEKKDRIAFNDEYSLSAPAVQPD